MNTKEFLIYLLIMAGSTYLIRAIPFALMRKKIKNQNFGTMSNIQIWRLKKLLLKN